MNSKGLEEGAPLVITAEIAPRCLFIILLCRKKQRGAKGIPLKTCLKKFFGISSHIPPNSETWISRVNSFKKQKLFNEGFNPRSSFAQHERGEDWLKNLSGVFSCLLLWTSKEVRNTLG